MIFPLTKKFKNKNIFSENIEKKILRKEAILFFRLYYYKNFITNFKIELLIELFKRLFLTK